MKIEDQVCSLENAKKLGELGVETRGIFLWVLLDATEQVLPCDFYLTTDSDRYLILAPAHTSAELGEMLPVIPLWSSQKSFDEGWSCYANHKTNQWGHAEYADTEADARALMLIWLIENGHVKAEVV